MVTAAAPEISTDTIQRIPLDQLHDSPLNPRRQYDAAALDELTASLRENGQTTPLIVRPDRKKGGYEVAAGSRRTRAAAKAGLTHLRAEVRELDDRTFRAIALTEQLQHKGLTDLEEAEGFRELMPQLDAKDKVAAIAATIGKSPRYVYDSLSFLKLSPEAKKLFLEGRFERGHAILLARLTPDWQKKALTTQFNRYGDGRGALWEAELFEQEPGQQRLKLDDRVKPVSVREFQTWIDNHVRATPAAVDPVLFPSAAELLARAQAAKGRAAKIIHITYQRQVKYTARDPKQKTYGAEAWKRADGHFGSKTCNHSVVGFVAAGPRRNDAFLVCINKEKCAVHWGDWQRERERRRKALASSRGKATRKDRAQAAEPEKPAKPAAPEPDDACRQRVGDAIVDEAYPTALKAIRAIIDKLGALPDEIIWNIAYAILHLSDGLDDWVKPPKRPGYQVGGRLDDAGIWERGLLPRLLKALPGKFGTATHNEHRDFKDAAGARTSLAIEIYLVRDYKPGAIDDRFDRDVAADWKAELKRRAAEQAKTSKPEKPAKVKPKAKRKKR